MKFIKKINIIIMIFTTLFILTGCGKEKNIEGNLEDLMTKIYEGIPEEERPMMLTNVEVTADTAEYYLGTNDIEYEEALASEPEVTSIAHSVVLIRVKENADVESIKTKIKENVKPNKWLCTEAEEVAVENRGNLIILVMSSSSNVDKIITGFNNL